MTQCGSKCAGFIARALRKNTVLTSLKYEYAVRWMSVTFPPKCDMYAIAAVPLSMLSWLLMLEWVGESGGDTDDVFNARMGGWGKVPRDSRIAVSTYHEHFSEAIFMQMHKDL